VETNVAPPINRSKKSSIPEFSRPFYMQKVKLQSQHAQQVMDRGFKLCSEGIYSLTVKLPKIATDEQIREITGMIDDRFTKLFSDIRDESARLGNVIESNGIDISGIRYSNAFEFDVEITSPHAVNFIGLIRELDVLVEKVDILWLANSFDGQARDNKTYEWKRRLLRFSGEMRSLAARAYSAARKKEQAIASKKADSTNKAVSGSLSTEDKTQVQPLDDSVKAESSALQTESLPVEAGV